MKRHYYIAPETRVTELAGQPLMESVSGYGVNFGGTDDGTHTPGSRRYRNSLWDSDEEDW